MSVGNGVPWLLPGVGAVATQSLTNVSFGPMALRMLREGVSASHIIRALVASDDGEHRRQVAVVDSRRDEPPRIPAKGVLPRRVIMSVKVYSVQANMMTTRQSFDAMAKAFESTTGDLATRMIAVLEAHRPKTAIFAGCSQPRWSLSQPILTSVSGRRITACAWTSTKIQLWS